jgi:hypothetical protein
LEEKEMRYSQSITIITILILLLAALATAPTAALKVEGAKIMMDVMPGTTYTFPMAVSIKPEDAATEYAIDILGFGQTVEAGSYQGLQPAEDTSPYSARPYISVPSPTIRLQPGERNEFSATIRVPRDVGDGGRYAVILIHPTAAGTGQAAFATAVLVPVMLTVEGSNLVETGEITAVTVGDVIAGKPVVVSTTLENTGNHHYYGTINQVSIRDAAGKEIGSAKTEPFSRAIIPTSSVRFDTPLTAGLPLGTYTVVSRMTLEDGTLLDEESTTFTVKEEYVPPFAETTVTVVPDRETVLRTPGGEITITFPAGAVLSDAEVIVSPYTQALPPPPAGAKAGTTAFTVEGLTGLLAKPATMVVKYNPADVQAASGNAGTLSLARWDRAEGKWIMLPTTVDSGKMTLATTTDRFGIIAVMAGGEATKRGSIIPGPHPAVIFGVLAMFAMHHLKKKK